MFDLQWLPVELKVRFENATLTFISRAGLAGLCHEYLPDLLMEFVDTSLPQSIL